MSVDQREQLAERNNLLQVVYQAIDKLSASDRVSTAR